MSNCKEFLLDDLLTITCIPVSDYNPNTAAWQLTPTISADGFSPTLTHAITISMRPAVTEGTLIPIMRGTGKAADDESDSVAGRMHTVKVSCEIDDRDISVWNHLMTLERTAFHLLLTFRDNTRAFVQATEDTYLCTVDRNGSKTSFSIRIQNLMGIQMITA